LNTILSNINSLKCSTILADDTADIGGIEKIFLYAHYLDVKHMIIKEEFLQFVPTTDITGKGLIDIILTNVNLV